MKAILADLSGSPTGDETWSLGVDDGLPRSYVGMLLSPLAPARQRLPSVQAAAPR